MLVWTHYFLFTFSICGSQIFHIFPDCKHGVLQQACFGLISTDICAFLCLTVALLPAGHLMSQRNVSSFCTADCNGLLELLTLKAPSYSASSKVIYMQHVRVCGKKALCWNNQEWIQSIWQLCMDVRSPMLAPPHTAK